MEDINKKDLKRQLDRDFWIAFSFGSLFVGTLGMATLRILLTYRVPMDSAVFYAFIVVALPMVFALLKYFRK